METAPVLRSVIVPEGLVLFVSTVIVTRASGVIRVAREPRSHIVPLPRSMPKT